MKKRRDWRSGLAGEEPRDMRELERQIEFLSKRKALTQRQRERLAYLKRGARPDPEQSDDPCQATAAGRGVKCSTTS